MAGERMPEGLPPMTLPTGSDAAATDAARRAIRVQMLATEHWSLLATRSMSWNESFVRAGMFLTLLSGAVVALALVAQATEFGEGFILFAVLVLPVVLFVGLATYVRLIEVQNEDVVWVRGMNRLRRAYLEIDPELARHFVTGSTEDAAGVLRTYGTHISDGSNLLHGFVTTPATIAFVVSMVSAVLGAILVGRIGMQMTPAAGIGVVIFLLTFAILAVYGYRSTVMATLVSREVGDSGETPDGTG
ncbi:MAG TPA: hypothetical protein VEW45_03005 [Candidatus Dormibacteraeota bacterium]|nr:hypothetical protein [Candidatus Dormibacteraeota bacterium]